MRFPALETPLPAPARALAAAQLAEGLAGRPQGTRPLVWATGTRWRPVRGLPPGSVGAQVGGPRPSSHAHLQSTLSLRPGSPVAAHSLRAGAGECGIPQTWAQGSGREEGPLGVGDRGAVMTRVKALPDSQVNPEARGRQVRAAKRACWSPAGVRTLSFVPFLITSCF